MDELDVLEKRKKKLNADLRDTKSKLLTSFDANSVESMRVEGVGLMYTSRKIYAKVADDEACRAWLHEIGRDEVITESVNKTRLAGLVKELLKKGDAVPDSVEYTEPTEIKLTRS